MYKMKVLKQIDCRYLINEIGEVYSLFGSRGLRKEPKKIKTQLEPEPKGYVRITVFFDGNKRFNSRLHRLVASAFLNLDLFNKNLSVHHKDGNKKNNHFSNLEILPYRVHARRTLIKVREKEKHFFTKAEKSLILKIGFDKIKKEIRKDKNIL